MRIRIRQLTVPLDYDVELIRRTVAVRLGLKPRDLEEPRIVRRSLDARGDGKPSFILTVEVVVSEEPPGAKMDDRNLERLPDELPDPPPPLPPWPAGRPRPVVVGAGPAGLAAAVVLAEAGAAPLVLELGGPVEERRRRVSAFWKEGQLDFQSNVLFGEGGAGLFSDGKLKARTKDRVRVRQFLDILVEAGAPAAIRIDSEPHLGSDVLARLVPALRRRIHAAGGEVRFGFPLEDLLVEEGNLTGVFAGGMEIRTGGCVLATGHSSRSVPELVGKAGGALESKPFAMGLRLEIPQRRIDQARLGRWATHERLGAASFRITRRPESRVRACFSFCMCPGGTVICCAGAAGEVLTNGMSLSSRSGPLGNAAFLVPVAPEDYPTDTSHAADPLAGYRFQARWEQVAFRAAGSDYSLPASPLGDFMTGRRPTSLPDRRSCQRTRPVDLSLVLPRPVAATLRKAIPAMLRELPGVSLEEALLYGPETRSSSPVRICREPDGQAVGIAGLYPAGEGSGYTGGIVSSGVDGIKAAEALLSRHTG